MLLLRADDTYTTTVDAGPAEKQAIYNVTKARPQGYLYMPSYRDGSWDGYVSLFNRNKFPTGLLSIVEVALKSTDLPYRIVWDSVPPTIDISQTNVAGYELRDYQEEAVVAALAHGRGVLNMATNAGKTLVAASVIQATGKRAVVVVPTRPLLLQTANRLESMLNVEVGRFGAGYENWQPVTVTTMASLSKLIAERRKYLSNNNTLFIDESHHTRADTIFDNIFNVPGAFRYGMSGTPLTYDKLSDLKLIGATGPIIYSVSNADLIGAGFSVPPIIFFVDITSPLLEDVEYDEAYRTCIVGNEMRNAKIGAICQSEQERGPILIMAYWIEHVNGILANMSSELRVEDATGNDTKEDIERKLYALGNHDLDVLVATDIFGEGIDVPAIATLILSGGGKSHIKILQKVGRGLRTAENKNVLHVYDFLDDTNEYLLGHSEVRYELYKDEGFEVRFAA